MENVSIKRYQLAADSIEEQIRNKLILPGEKIPSIREQSRKTGYSQNTIKTAYELLEKKGLITAIPQSGYYARWQKHHISPEPAVDPFEMNPEETSLCRIYSAYKEKNDSGNAFNLAIAAMDPDLYPEKALNKCFRYIINNKMMSSLQYDMPPGNPDLRRQIASMEQQQKSSLTSDDIVITNGCHESIFISLSLICRPGDTIAIESPCYFNFFQLLQQLKLNVLEIPSDPIQGPSLSALQFILENHKIKALTLISNFSNPSGFSIPENNKKEILKLAYRFDIPIIEDSIYSHLYFGRQPPVSLYSLDKRNKVIQCNSFSKNLGPGLRLGWMIPGPLKENAIRQKTIMNLGTSSIVQQGVAMYMKEYGIEKHTRNLRKVISNNIKEIRQLILTSFPKKTEVSDPPGGMALWVTLPENYSTRKIYTAAARNGTAFAPGSLFSLKMKYDNCMRLNAGILNDTVRQQITALGEYCKHTTI